MSQLSVATQTPDPARVEAFGERLLGIYNDAALAQMISLGHRTGLFDTLNDLPPATSGEIAAAAGLNERYVREWLGAMVTGGFIEYEPATASYRLPGEHAALLTRDASPNNFAVFAQYFPIMGAVEDRILDCFRNGGGVSYEEYGDFHRVMAEDSGQTVVAALEEHILPLAPGLERRLAEGIDVLDIGCGSGRAVNLLASRFPNSRFRGIDLSEEAVGRARAEADRLGLRNVRFAAHDLTTWTVDGRYDLVTAFDAIHDQAAPARVLAEIRRVLRPDGLFLMQDIAGSSRLEENLDHPVAPLLYTISCMHCMTVSLAQDGAGLGTMWGEDTALRMLGEAGFGPVEVKRLAHDFQNAYFLARRNGSE